MARILVVEDDALLSSIIVRELVEAGHDVRVAYDGEQALKEAETTTPELILLDLLLPKMDGFETLKHLKEKPETSNIPVIVLTNLGQQSDIDKAKAAGAADYMVKINFAPKEVREMVNTFLTTPKK